MFADRVVELELQKVIELVLVPHLRTAQDPEGLESPEGWHHQEISQI